MKFIVLSWLALVIKSSFRFSPKVANFKELIKLFQFAFSSLIPIIISFALTPLLCKGPAFSISIIFSPFITLPLVFILVRATLKFPIQRVLTLPYLINWVAIWTTRFDGIANPIPWYAPVLENIFELIPIKLPFSFIRAPPELPGLIAASVWISWR